MGGWVGALLALAAGVAVLLGVARAALMVVRVDGTSMAPTFQPGDAVLALRRRLRRPVRRGDIVVCRIPPGVVGPPTLLIKRINAVAGDEIPTEPASPAEPATPGRVPPGQVFVCGDGPHSYDSRQFGPIPLQLVVGLVVARLALGPK